MNSDPVSITSPLIGSSSSQTSESRSGCSSRLTDDITGLTSFNPFAEEDEHDQSSYTLVTSIFSRMKNTLSAPRSSAVAAVTSPIPPASPSPIPPQGIFEQRRPSYTPQTQTSTVSSKIPGSDRPFSFTAAPPQVAPPLVSLTPAHSEVPTYNVEDDRSPSRSNFHSPVFETTEGVPSGYSIPGFPIQDDARSIKTTASLHRSGSVSKIMRRIRGEGIHPIMHPILILM